MAQDRVQIGSVAIGAGVRLAVIAGPCVIESRDHTLRLADAIADVCRHADIPFVFKASFDKANRSSVDSFRGPGIAAGLAILREVHDELGIPILSDIHLPEQAASAAAVLDCLQIPAFLCRQTDLLAEAGKTGKPINVKKGQFMSPEEMANAAHKIESTGNHAILLTERGTFFGYNTLVNDMTAIPRMQKIAPVVFDATHSCQRPGSAGSQSGGSREFTATLARAGVAAGCDALFLEVHDNPSVAKSDPATVYPLDQLATLLESCARIADVIRQ